MAMPLPVGGAFHTPFMGSASDRLAKAIDKVEFREPDFPVYANVDAAAHTNPADWPDLLSRQLCSPVRWCQQMRQIIADGGSTFVEIGPGKALTAMIKRIDKSKETYCINTPDDIDVLLKSLGTSDLALGEHLYVHERIVVSPAAGIFAASEDIQAGHSISVGSVIGKGRRPGGLFPLCWPDNGLSGPRHRTGLRQPAAGVASHRRAAITAAITKEAQNEHQDEPATPASPAGAWAYPRGSSPTTSCRAP